MKIDVNPWQVPNFVTLKMPVGKRQDGFTPAPSLALSEVDTDTLAAMCDAFRAEVFRKAGKPDPGTSGSGDEAQSESTSADCITVAEKDSDLSSDSDLPIEIQQALEQQVEYLIVAARVGPFALKRDAYEALSTAYQQGAMTPRATPGDARRLLVKVLSPWITRPPTLTFEQWETAVDQIAAALSSEAPTDKGLIARTMEALESDQIRILMQSAWDCGGRAADAKHDDDVALFAKAREEVRIRESNCRACPDEYGKGLHAAYRAVLDLISEDDWIRDALNDASDEASSGGTTTSCTTEANKKEQSMEAPPRPAEATRSATIRFWHDRASYLRDALVDITDAEECPEPRKRAEEALAEYDAAFTLPRPAEAEPKAVCHNCAHAVEGYCWVCAANSPPRPAEAAPAGLKHSLTLEFNHVLSEDEWSDVAEKATRLPHVQSLTANAVDGSTPAGLRQAAQALVDKLNEMIPHFNSMALLAHVHGASYNGPNFGGELKALAAALQEREP